MNIQISKDAAFLLRTLESSGYQAYLVGGCIRDSLLGIEPKDWDVATNAHPLEIANLFSSFHPKQSDLKTGVVKIVLEDRPYELTPFRVETGTADHRHPQKVRFVNSVTADLARRDFTINAMAYHPQEGLIDPYGGLCDLSEGKIRTVGSPQLRFWEDSIRILRALRFSARYRFSITPATQQAICTQSPLLASLPVERILSELLSFLCEPFPAFSILSSPEPLLVCIPELSPFLSSSESAASFHAQTKDSPLFRTAQAMELAPSSPDIRLATLMSPLALPCYSAEGSCLFSIANRSVSARVLPVLKRLKASRSLQKQVLFFLSALHLPCPSNKQKLLFWLRRFGQEPTKQLLLFRHCLAVAGSPALSESSISAWEEAINKLHQLTSQSICYSTNQLAVSGNDLMAIGFPPGKELGLLLERLLDLVIEETIPNKKNSLLQEARQELDRISIDQHTPL